MRGLPTRYGTHIITFIVDGIHAFIGPICLLLGQERAETAVALRPAGSIPRNRIVRAEPLHIVILRLVVGASRDVVYRVKVTDISGHADIFPPDIEEAQLPQIVDEQVAQSDSLSRLLQSIFVAVDLRQYGTKLHLQPSDDDKLAHSIAYGAFLEVQVVHRQVVQRLVDARGALLQHLHLLVAQRHIVEHDEEVKLVPAAGFKIDHVHDPVGLLQQIERPLVLLALNESIGTVIELGEDYGDLIFADAELLVVMLVERVVFVERTCCLVGARCIRCCLLGSSNCRSCTSDWCSGSAHTGDLFCITCSSITLIWSALFIPATWHRLTFSIGGYTSETAKRT